MVNLTQFLAHEWARNGVRVNSITPGFFPAEQNRALLFHKDGSPTPRAQSILGRWVTEQPTSFPPIVINITDGQATDGDPAAAANTLKDLKTEDGPVLLFNIHVSSRPASPIEFPSDESRLPDDYAKHLFRMSSPLPGYMKTIAIEEGIPVGDSPRGFVFNGDMVSVIRFLDIGTRPTSLR